MTRDADRLKPREQSLEERRETTTDRSPSIKSAASDSTRYLRAPDRNIGRRSENTLCSDGFSTGCILRWSKCRGSATCGFGGGARTPGYRSNEQRVGPEAGSVR